MKKFEIRVNGHRVSKKPIIAAKSQNAAIERWLVKVYGSVFHGPYNVSAKKLS